MNRTYVPCEVDALANIANDSPAAVREKIESNRKARLVATGEDFVTGEEVDWMLACIAEHGDFPTHAVMLERARAVFAADWGADIPVVWAD